MTNAHGADHDFSAKGRSRAWISPGIEPLPEWTGDKPKLEGSTVPEKNMFFPNLHKNLPAIIKGQKITKLPVRGKIPSITSKPVTSINFKDIYRRQQIHRKRLPSYIRLDFECHKVSEQKPSCHIHTYLRCQQPKKDCGSCPCWHTKKQEETL